MFSHKMKHTMAIDWVFFENMETAFAWCIKTQIQNEVSASDIHVQ